MTKLEQLLQYSRVPKHKNGAQLKGVEVSEESSVIPEGALHAHKHHLEGLEGKITNKGIPVIQNVDDSVQTFAEVKWHGGDILQSAEIEREEVIFSRELTDFIEEKRKEWHETGSNEILEDVGKRVTKELLFNTNDNADLITKIEMS